ncbi:MAG TPA: diacylglycerol kinase family protein, partial [Candidatus Sulfopaludibacter sp.]|nr:diacylglycerol kinase family protein [Candidatus Sulfopaludibacter sp.]
MTSYRKTVLIYNPRAGKFGPSGGARNRRLADILTGNGHDVTVAPTTGPGTAGAIACSAIQNGAGLIVAAGGDGTINEVAEGMVHSPVPLAILPGGTANVLAMEMKLGSKLEKAAARLDECRPHRISVGRLRAENGRLERNFLMMAGIGLDAHIVYHVNQRLKARTGKFAYWVAGWSLLGRRLPEFEIEADGRRFVCSFALVSKVRNYGGDFEIARAVSLFDDEFEVVVFEGSSSLRYVPYFLGLAANRLQGMKGVTMLRAGHVTLAHPRDERVYIQVDGEAAGHL